MKVVAVSLMSLMKNLY